MNQWAEEDTEWHDALRRCGIIHRKQEGPIEEEAPVLNMVDQPEAKGGSDGSTTDSDIEQLLDDYCKHRRADLAAEVFTISKERQYSLREITREDYVKEVAEASRVKPILILLYDQGQDSRKIEAALLEVSEELYGRVGICKIRADECIPGYPSRNIPTLILYVDGAAKKNYVGIGQIHTSKKLTPAQNITEELKTNLDI